MLVKPKIIMDMMDMLGKLREVQAKIKEVQDSLEEIQVEGESGGGMIKVVANGKKQLVKINIDPSLLNEGDKEMLQDLMVAAVNKAIEEAEQKAQAAMQEKTQGMLPNIPGMNFGM